tara:strand:- start:25 stop:261 length:237 start_codon:yes stop_codon:yes gene_type:complete
MKKINIDLEIQNVSLTVIGAYYKGEPMIMYDHNLEGDPGYSAYCDVYAVIAGKVDITSLISETIFVEIQEKMLELQKL